MGGHARVVAYRRRIRCQKIFAVPGNHDKQARKLKEDFLWLDNLAEVSIHGQPIVLCHYALRVWNQSTADHGTSTDILTDACLRFPTHSPWMWESTPTIFVHGTSMKLRRR